MLGLTDIIQTADRVVFSLTETQKTKLQLTILLLHGTGEV
jgi:hypothetical protein